jgi:3-hydroxy-9,10-secoandrosta-1,3,5(10)-triene-9,17-dione monooxygenase
MSVYLERAQALLPRLAERVDEARSLRRLPDATVQDLQDSGILRMLQPARWGGGECTPLEFFTVQHTLASVSPATAWVLGVVGVHAWQLALFDEQAQQDVWGDDPSTLISSSYAPVGKVTRVDGGFRLSGRWSFSSGSDHCQWVFVGGFAPTEKGSPPDMRTFLVPRSDYQVVDVWHTTALQATGSNDVVVDDVFVPEHRTHRLFDGFKCDSPGNAGNPGATFRLPFGQVFVRSVSTTAIGILAGALGVFTDNARSKFATSDGSRVMEDPHTQEVLARAATVLDEVLLVLARDCDVQLAMARAGERIPLDLRVQHRFNSANAVVRCVEQVDVLMNTSGGRALYKDHPLNRFFQDAQAARAHYANNPAKPARNLGWMMLGQKTRDFFL